MHYSASTTKTILPLLISSVKPETNASYRKPRAQINSQIFLPQVNKTGLLRDRQLLGLGCKTIQLVAPPSL